MGKLSLLQVEAPVLISVCSLDNILVLSSAPCLLPATNAVCLSGLAKVVVAPVVVAV